MSARIELLKPVCSTDETRPNLGMPFAADLWGAKWAVATNGHAMAGFLCDEAPVIEKAPNIAAVLPAEVNPKGKTTLAALREWAGEPIGRECEECGGEGEVDHKCNCSLCSASEEQCGYCGGTGTYVGNRYGRIVDGVLNRNLLSGVLKSAPESGEVLVAHDRELAPFIFRAGDWMAAIMPVRPDETAKKVTEAFAALEPISAR